MIGTYILVYRCPKIHIHPQKATKFSDMIYFSVYTYRSACAVNVFQALQLVNRGLTTTR